MTAGPSDVALSRLRRRLVRCWDADTSAGGWPGHGPATGQCAVTALLVQDLFGGDIVRGAVPGGSHYWNAFGGREVDLTRDQFDEFVLEGPPATRAREQVLAAASTAARYRLLRDRVLGPRAAAVPAALADVRWADRATA